MDRNSNAYTFIYATVMVVVVAVLLTFVSLTLKPEQERNVRTEKIQNILLSVGVESTVENAEQLYDTYITQELLVNTKGDVVSVYAKGEKVEGEEIRPFSVKLKGQLRNEKKEAGSGMFPIYVADVDGKRRYVVPMLGKGLWAAVWGNIALDADWNTVVDANFGHKSETPGLGAEIAEAKASGKVVFSDLFIGKKLFNEAGDFQSIAVVKGGVANQNLIPLEHGVDAISGGTLTCDGVANMLTDCLSNYVNYIKKQEK